MYLFNDTSKVNQNIKLHFHKKKGVVFFNTFFKTKNMDSATSLFSKLSLNEKSSHSGPKRTIEDLTNVQVGELVNTYEPTIPILPPVHGTPVPYKGYGSLLFNTMKRYFDSGVLDPEKFMLFWIKQDLYPFRLYDSVKEENIESKPSMYRLIYSLKNTTRNGSRIWDSLVNSGPEFSKSRGDYKSMMGHVLLMCSVIETQVAIEGHQQIEYMLEKFKSTTNTSFGDDWLTDGKWAIRMVKPVYVPDETIYHLAHNSIVARVNETASVILAITNATLRSIFGVISNDFDILEELVEFLITHAYDLRFMGENHESMAHIPNIEMRRAIVYNIPNSQYIQKGGAFLEISLRGTTEIGSYSLETLANNVAIYYTRAVSQKHTLNISGLHDSIKEITVNLWSNTLESYKRVGGYRDSQIVLEQSYQLSLSQGQSRDTPKMDFASVIATITMNDLQNVDQNKLERRINLDAFLVMVSKLHMFINAKYDVEIAHNYSIKMTWDYLNEMQGTVAKLNSFVKHMTEYKIERLATAAKIMSIENSLFGGEFLTSVDNVIRERVWIDPNALRQFEMCIKTRSDNVIYFP